MQTAVTVTELKALETAETEKPKIRLAPYCRVSSPSEDQLHSFAAQIRHYTEYVGTHLCRRRAVRNLHTEAG